MWAPVLRQPKSMVGEGAPACRVKLSYGISDPDDDSASRIDHLVRCPVSGRNLAAEGDDDGGKRFFRRAGGGEGRAP